jgi:hypothetical protein
VCSGARLPPPPGRSEARLPRATEPFSLPSGELHPSLTGVISAVKYGQSNGSVTSAESTKLQGLLNAANPVKTNLTNFMNEVKAHSGKAISAAEATLLLSWAQDLYNRS